MFSCPHHFEISLKLSKIFSRVTFTNVETRSRNAVTSPCNTSASCFTNCGFKNPPYLLNTTHIFTLFYLHNTCKSLNVHSRPLVSVFVVSSTSELLPQICSDKVATQTPPKTKRSDRKLRKHSQTHSTRSQWISSLLNSPLLWRLSVQLASWLARPLRDAANLAECLVSVNGIITAT